MTAVGVSELTKLLLGIGLVAGLAWLFLGGGPQAIAGWFWPTDAAPWEEVHAFYYPNKNDLTVDERQYNVASLETCRQWVREIAKERGDEDLTAGDYECGIGCRFGSGDLLICRLTMK